MQIYSDSGDAGSVGNEVPVAVAPAQGRPVLAVPATSKLAATMSSSRLNPTVVIDGKNYTVMTQEIAGVDRNQLGIQANDLSLYRSEIIAALDFVLSGI